MNYSRPNNKKRCHFQAVYIGGTALRGRKVTKKGLTERVDGPRETECSQLLVLMVMVTLHLPYGLRLTAYVVPASYRPAPALAPPAGGNRSIHSMCLTDSQLLAN